MSRRLDSTYYGAPNWIAIFTLAGLFFAYIFRTIIYPKCKKLHHYITKKRVETTLDGIDGLDFEEMLARTCPMVNPETGENVVFSTLPPKLNELDEMKQLLSQLWADEEAEKKRKFMEENEDIVIGPDGKIMLPDILFDKYGYIISNSDLEVGGRNGTADEEESKEAKGSVRDKHDRITKLDDRPLPQPRPKSNRKGKKEKGDTGPKKLSPKKIAALERKQKENKAFRDAYKKATRIPRLDERLKIVREQFEQRMLHGEEPLGHQLTLERRKEIQASSDITQYAMQQHGNFFHKLVEKDNIAMRREEYIEELNLSKYEHPVHVMVVEAKDEIEAHRELSLGFIKKKVSRPHTAGTTRSRHCSPSPQRRSVPHEVLKSDGKNLEDAGARDKTVVTRGYGSLPTRNRGALDGRERAVNLKQDNSTELREYFKADGSGKPVNGEERERIVRERQRGKELDQASSSPSGRSPSPLVEVPSRQRPRTAAQFRRQYF